MHPWVPYLRLLPSDSDLLAGDVVLEQLVLINSTSSLAGKARLRRENKQGNNLCQCNLHWLCGFLSLASLLAESERGRPPYIP